MFQMNQIFQIGKEHVFKNNQSFQQSNNENVNMKGTKYFHVDFQDQNQTNCFKEK
jgi:hypothetical protein